MGCCYSLDSYKEEPTLITKIKKNRSKTNNLRINKLKTSYNYSTISSSESIYGPCNIKKLNTATTNDITNKCSVLNNSNNNNTYINKLYINNSLICKTGCNLLADKVLNTDQNIKYPSYINNSFITSDNEYIKKEIEEIKNTLSNKACYKPLTKKLSLNSKNSLKRRYKKIKIIKNNSLVNNRSNSVLNSYSSLHESKIVDKNMPNNVASFTNYNASNRIKNIKESNYTSLNYLNSFNNCNSNSLTYKNNTFTVNYNKELNCALLESKNNSIIYNKQKNNSKLNSNYTLLSLQNNTLNKVKNIENIKLNNNKVLLKYNKFNERSENLINHNRSNKYTSLNYNIENKVNINSEIINKRVSNLLFKNNTLFDNVESKQSKNYLIKNYKTDKCISDYNTITNTTNTYFKGEKFRFRESNEYLTLSPPCFNKKNKIQPKESSIIKLNDCDNKSEVSSEISNNSNKHNLLKLRDLKIKKNKNKSIDSEYKSKKAVSFLNNNDYNNTSINKSFAKSSVYCSPYSKENLITINSLCSKNKQSFCSDLNTNNKYNQADINANSPLKSNNKKIAFRNSNLAKYSHLFKDSPCKSSKKI